MILVGVKNHKSRKRRLCDWWCVACGGQFDWREGNTVLTTQASCRLEDIWVFKAHAPPPGACDNMIILREKGNIIEVVHEGIKESSRRKVVAAFEASH